MRSSGSDRWWGGRQDEHGVLPAAGQACSAVRQVRGLGGAVCRARHLPVQLVSGGRRRQIVRQPQFDFRHATHG